MLYKSENIFVFLRLIVFIYLMLILFDCLKKNYWIVYDDYLIGSFERFRYWRIASVGVRAIDIINVINYS